MTMQRGGPPSPLNQTPMTMPLAPNTPGLPNGAWLAILADEDMPTFREAVDELADEYTEEYGEIMQASIDAFNLKPPPPKERLARYLLKPLVAWIEQKQKYIEDFTVDMADFGRLRDRAARGEFDKPAGRP
jgi:hypothetical protein